MKIYGPQLTARQAADQFAAEAFEEPRKVGTWIINPTRFQLVRGKQWYLVECLPTYDGWEITCDYSVA
jgi:hypothetical protein